MKKQFPSLFYLNNNYNKYLNKSDINNLKYKKRFYNKNLNLYKYFISFISFRNYVGFKKILDVKKNVLNIQANYFLDITYTISNNVKRDIATLLLNTY